MRTGGRSKRFRIMISNDEGVISRCRSVISAFRSAVVSGRREKRKRVPDLPASLNRELCRFFSLFFCFFLHVSICFDAFTFHPSWYADPCREHGAPVAHLAFNCPASHRNVRRRRLCWRCRRRSFLPNLLGHLCREVNNFVPLNCPSAPSIRPLLGPPICFGRHDLGTSHEIWTGPHEFFRPIRPSIGRPDRVTLNDLDQVTLIGLDSVTLIGLDSVTSNDLAR